MIVAGSWGRPVASWSENRSVGGKAASSAANAVFALRAVGPRILTDCLSACCWEAVARIVWSNSEISAVSCPSARARPSLARANPEITRES